MITFILGFSIGLVVFSVGSICIILSRYVQKYFSKKKKFDWNTYNPQYQLFINADGKLFYEDSESIALIPGITYDKKTNSIYYYTKHVVKKNH